MKGKDKKSWLYISWAIEHLVAIDEAIMKLSVFSSIDMLGIINAMCEERDKLINEDISYKEAYKTLKKINVLKAS